MGSARSHAHCFVAYLMSARSSATNNSLPTAVRKSLGAFSSRISWSLAWKIQAFVAGVLTVLREPTFENSLKSSASCLFGTVTNPSLPQAGVLFRNDPSRPGTNVGSMVNNMCFAIS